ncbi:MAG: EamA family transporter [Paracoccaceae bacterium]
MSGAVLGQTMALASAICFALVGALLSRTTLTKGDRGVTFSVIVTIVFSTILWLFLEGPDLSPMQANGAWIGMAWFALAGLCAMVFGRSLLYVSIRRLGVTRASATKRLNPFFSVALAALVLAEPIGLVAAGGMALIALAFWLLVRTSLRNPRPRPDGSEPTLLDYVPGIIAALAYAAAYITRKLGLDHLPSPALGTLISALAGLAVFAALSVVNLRQRQNMLGMFRQLDGWTAGAAVAMSVGQILMFAALLYEDVSVVAIISSLEVFLASFLAVVIFKSEARPDKGTIVAAALAMVGVIVVALA